MDRARLQSLEERKARLVELRLKRLGLDGDRSLAASPIAAVARAPVTVEKGVQTDTGEAASVNTLLILEQQEPQEPELTRFNKAIQTSWEPIAENTPKLPPPPAQSPAKPPTVTVYIPQVPPPTPFERFVAARTQAQPVKDDTTAAIAPQLSDVGLLYRKPVYMDASPHFPELMVVAFSAKSPTQAGDLAGAAMVYSVDDMTPKFLLSCMLPLTVIKFDTMDPKRIIGGGGDGLVVIWDLNTLSSLEVALWPQLTTPLHRIDHLILEVSYIPHKLAIVALHQYSIQGSHILVLVLMDGVVNTWSPSLLACPKHDLVVINATSSSFDTGDVSQVILKSLIVVGNDGADALDDQSDLKRLFVIEENGTIYQCSGDRKREFTAIVEATSPVSDVEALLDKTLASTHLDNTLQFWGFTNAIVTPLHSLRTDVTVVKVALRLAFQIATIGINRHNTQVLEFWDFSTSKRPIVTITVTDSVTSLRFSTNGSVLLLGFDLGKVIKYTLDETQLLQKSKEQKSEGIQALQAF